MVEDAGTSIATLSPSTLGGTMPTEDPCHANDPCHEAKAVQSPNDLSEWIFDKPRQMGSGVPASPAPIEEFIEESDAGAETESSGADEFTNLRVDEVDTGET
jgi:hypothetical protein